MKLDHGVDITISNGQSIVVEDLDLVIVDRPSHKTVVVKVHPLARPLLVWKQQDYDTVGDYTQAQLEARVLEVLGEDLQQGLQTLFNIEIL